MDEIRNAVRAFLLENYLPGEDPAELTDSVPLITGGILDSIATLKLVVFLEKRFEITIDAHEADVDHLDSVSRIVGLVGSKRSAA